MTAFIRIVYCLITSSLFFTTGCQSLPPQKAKDLLCPKTTGSEDGDKTLDSMPVSGTEAVLICGHREDTRLAARRMRVSEAEIIKFNVAKNSTTSVWKTAALDVRYVQFFPKKKQIEIIWPVFKLDGQPVPVLRELIDCTTAECKTVEKKCVFKKNTPTEPLPDVKDLKKWLQDEDSVNRATRLFLLAAIGNKKASEIITDEKLAKIHQDGYFAKTMQDYRTLLSELKRCHQ